MSTVGSSPDARAALTPSSGAEVPSEKASKRRRGAKGAVRWRGLIPLALVIVLVAIGYTLFADRIARDVATDAATDMLGTQVDIAGLEILETQPGVVLRGVQIADPFDSTKNLLEIGRLLVSVEPIPALEKKFIVNELSIGAVRVGTKRATPAKPVKGDGLAPRVMTAVKQWRSQFDVPLLHLAPIDSIKAVAVDPTKLSAVRAAVAIRSDADSMRTDVTNRWNTLRVQETIDSARVLATRLSSSDPRSLGIAGVRTAVTDVRRTIAQIDSTKRRIDALQLAARAGVARLDANVKALDDSARGDFNSLRSLMALPSFAAPDIGDALFGPVTIDQLQKLLYWAALAEQYTPPGLRPRPEPGPKRLRAAGTTVHYVQRGELPDFWLKRGDLQLTVDQGAARGAYRLRVADVTTDPAIVGKPTLALLERVAGGPNGGIALRAAAVVDRLAKTPRDSVAVSLGGLPVPGFALPSTPFRLEPGPSQTVLSLARRGDAIAGRWELRSNRISWIADSARIRAANPVQQLAYRVIGGLQDVQVSATVSGTMTSPRVTARSNLDRLIADRVKSVIGEEAAKAEARLRSEVDRVVAERTAPVKARVAELRTEAESKIDEARARLDEERAKLDERLRTLTKGLVGLPGIG